MKGAGSWQGQLLRVVGRGCYRPRPTQGHLGRPVGGAPGLPIRALASPALLAPVPGRRRDPDVLRSSPSSAACVSGDFE